MANTLLESALEQEAKRKAAGELAGKVASRVAERMNYSGGSDNIPGSRSSDYQGSVTGGPQPHKQPKNVSVTQTGA